MPRQTTKFTLRFGRWLARLKLAGQFWWVLLLVTVINCCVSVGLNVLTYLILWPESIAEEWVTMIFVPMGITVLLTVPVIYMDFALVTALSRHRDDLAEQMRHDYLTGVASRSFFERHVRSAAVSRQGGGALLIADIDHFKSVNDTYGHHTGDNVLRQVGAAIRGAMRKGDIVGRIGGEEFAAYLPGADLDTSIQVAERLRRAVADVTVQVPASTTPLTVTISVGLKRFDAPCRFEDLYAKADAALYEAKDNGRNRLVVAEPRAAAA